MTAVILLRALALFSITIENLLIISQNRLILLVLFWIVLLSIGF